jgi:hypothetical protein
MRENAVIDAPWLRDESSNDDVVNFTRQIARPARLVHFENKPDTARHAEECLQRIGVRNTLALFFRRSFGRREPRKS